MPRKCTVCKHKKRKEIDTAIQNSVAYGILAVKYNLTDRALGGHYNNHLKPIIEQANNAAEKSLVNKILKFREEVNYKSLEKVKYAQHKIIGELEFADNVSERIAIIKEFRGWFQEEAKLLGAYTKERENPATIEKLAEVINDYIKENPEMDKQKIVEVFARKANVDIQDVSKLVNW